MAAPTGRNRDTSHWQTRTATPLEPRDLDMHKATQGGSYRDPTAKKFLAEYRACGTKRVGAYHYVTSLVDARRQVDHFCDTVASLDLGFELDFVVVDWEVDEAGKIAPVELVEEVCRLLDERFPTRPGGTFRVGVYGSDWVAGFKTWRLRNPLRPLFYANYSLSDTPSGGAAESALHGAVVWQWTSKGVDPGFTAGIDLNEILNAAWLEGLTGSQAGPTPVPPDPAPTPTPEPPPAHPVVGIPDAGLELGSGGRHVGRLIAILKAFHWYPAQWLADRNNQAFGPRTRQGVLAFQAWAGLPRTGRYGARERAKLIELSQALTGSEGGA